MPLSRTKRVDRRLKSRAGLLHFPFNSKRLIMARRRIDQASERITRLVAIVDRRIQRHIAAQAAIHVEYFPLGHLELLGNCLGLFWPQVPILQSRDSALRTSQFE